MFKNPRTIKFNTVAGEHEYVPLPTSAKLHIPEWYKKSPRFVDGAKKVRVSSRDGATNMMNLGLKTCVPFLDGMTAGYTACLWQDVHVEIVDGRTEIRWPNRPDVLSGRDPDGLETFPVPAGHSSIQYVWVNPFVIETPPGYSIHLTHPLNRFDLPFTTLSGVVDSDGIMGAGHYPFYLKEGFEGVIEAGTPIYQIIPFKRENWVAETDPELINKGHKRFYESTSKLMGHYKDTIWSKKTYE